MTEEQRIFMAVGKALVKTVRERFPISHNIKSLWTTQIMDDQLWHVIGLVRAKKKYSEIIKGVISSAKRSLKFGERDAVCDELCALVFSLLYMSDIFLPQNSFVTRFGTGSHAFLVLHTDLGGEAFFSRFDQYDVEFEAGFEQIEVFFRKRNAVIIDPWISCVVPVEDWLSLGKQAEEYKVMNFFKGQYKGRWSESLENRNSSELYKSLNKETSVFIPLKKGFIDYYEKIKEKDISIYRRTFDKAQRVVDPYIKSYTAPKFNAYCENETVKQVPGLLLTLIDKLISIPSTITPPPEQQFSTFAASYQGDDTPPEQQFSTFTAASSSNVSNPGVTAIFTELKGCMIKNLGNESKFLDVFFCCVVLSFVSTDGKNFSYNTPIAQTLLKELNSEDKKMRPLRYYLRLSCIETKTIEDLLKIRNDKSFIYSNLDEFYNHCIKPLIHY